MPKLTPLAQHLLVALGLSLGVWLYFSFVYALIVSVIIFTIAVFTTPDPTDAKTITPMDRFMMNIKRLLRGKNRWGFVAGVMHFEQGNQPTVEIAREVMQQVALEYPRFGSVAVPSAPIEFSFYRRCLSFDMEYHIQEHKLAGATETQRMRDELLNAPLDPTKPLWRFDILVNDSGPGMVIMRIDHCMADGLRLIKAASGFLFFEDGRPAELALLKKMSDKKLSTKEGRSTLTLALQFLQDLPRVLFQDRVRKEDPSCFHTPGTTFDVKEDRVCLTSSVSFSDIRIIKDSCPNNTTINDVVLAAFLGALQRYSQSVGQPLKPGALMRAMCAVSLPDQPGRGKSDMYNHFVLPSFNLPVGITSTNARLRAVHDTMEGVKTSLSGIIVMLLSKLLGRLGLEVLGGDTQLRVFALHSFIYSNVPGMEQPVCLFSPKHRITGFEVYYPNLVSQTLFLTYCDRLTFSLATCTSQVKDPALLVQAFVDEVKAWREES